MYKYTGVMTSGLVMNMSCGMRQDSYRSWCTSDFAAVNWARSYPRPVPECWQLRSPGDSELQGGPLMGAGPTGEPPSTTSSELQLWEASSALLRGLGTSKPWQPTLLLQVPRSCSGVNTRVLVSGEPRPSQSPSAPQVLVVTVPLGSGLAVLRVWAAFDSSGNIDQDEDSAPQQAQCHGGHLISHPSHLWSGH